MSLRLVCVARKAPRWADDAVADYVKRLRRHGGLDEVQLKPSRFTGDVDAVRAEESDRLLALVSPRDRLVCLDERGDALDTEGFAALVDEGRQAGGDLVFALGGPYGHDARARAAAWRTVRLSSLVLNHQVARVLVVEQIYRAFCVLEGSPYHHA